MDRNFGSSISLVERVLMGKDPMLPDLKFAVVDVRDVAKMHVESIKNDESKGERILATAGTKSFVEIAKLLKAAYPKSNVKTVVAPTFLLRILSLFEGTIKGILPQLGKPMNVSGAKAKRVLGINFIRIDESVKRIS
ncbi:MAG: hypothetical protein NTY13_00760 [Chlamydiae bacterium]|nr:hypothetical protein [Chlamydiota bacterium]